MEANRRQCPSAACPMRSQSAHHEGIDAEKKSNGAGNRESTYVISVPILLYMAHPKWIQAGKVTHSTSARRYYCEKDVERHLEKWQKAADEKKFLSSCCRSKMAFRTSPNISMTGVSSWMTNDGHGNRHGHQYPWRDAAEASGKRGLPEAANAVPVEE